MNIDRATAIQSRSRSAAATRKGRRAAHGSEATWWVYYLTDEGKTVYITAIPLPKKNAMGHCRAAQRYYRGRHVIQITETPPNAPGERPGQEARELKP